MLARLLHLAAGILGLLLLYVSFFLTETAEGTIENRLAELWIKVDDVSKVALSKQAVFLRQVSVLLSSGLDRIFGKKLFSAEAAAASVCFSSVALVLFVSYLPGTTPTPWPEGVDVILLLLVLLGLSPKPMRYLAFCWPLIVFVGWFEMDFRAHPSHSNSFGHLLGIALIFVGGIASDFFFVAASRWSLRATEKLTSTFRILLLLLFNAGFGLLLISPALLSIPWVQRLIAPLFRGHNLARIFPSSQAFQTAMVTIMLVGGSNLLTAAIPLLFALLCLVAIIHLLLWPLLEGPLYSAQRYGLIHRQKLLVSVGVLCLLYAWPNSPLVRAVDSLRHAI